MSTRGIKKPKKSGIDRQSKKSWLDAALQALASGGVDKVRVESLAKNLGVTKGSFYWHFKDRQELLDALIEYWNDEMTRTVVENAKLFHGDPVQRIFYTLTDIVSNERTKYDPVVRAWGNHDERAKKFVEKVDRLRLKFLIGLFKDAGFNPEESEIRARLMYYYVLGEAFITKKESKAVRLKRIEKKAKIFTNKF